MEYTSRHARRCRIVSAYNVFATCIPDQMHYMKKTLFAAPLVYYAIPRPSWLRLSPSVSSKGRPEFPEKEGAGGTPGIQWDAYKSPRPSRSERTRKDAREASARARLQVHCPRETWRPRRKKWRREKRPRRKKWRREKRPRRKKRRRGRRSVVVVVVVDCYPSDEQHRHVAIHRPTRGGLDARVR